MKVPAVKPANLSRIYAHYGGGAAGDAAMQVLWDLGHLVWMDNDEDVPIPCEMVIAAELWQGTPPAMTRSFGVAAGQASRDVAIPGGFIRCFYNC
jgi:hypothetical protein